MRFHNASKNRLTSWKGHAINPGETVDIEVAEAEAEWLLRHGCVDSDAKPKPKPVAADDEPEKPRRQRSTRRRE